MEPEETNPKQKTNGHCVTVDFTHVNFRPHNIPSELRALPHWVCWKRNDEDKKLPVSPLTGKLAKTNDNHTWGDYGRALVRLQKDSCAGIGFVFNGGYYVGIDLDDCREPVTGAIEPWAEAIIEELDSYTEISPSGTGIHIIVIGQLSCDGKRSGKVEVYQKKRYPSSPLRQSTVLSSAAQRGEGGWHRHRPPFLCSEACRIWSLMITQ